MSLTVNINLCLSVLRGVGRSFRSPHRPIIFESACLWICGLALCMAGCTRPLESQVTLATDQDKEVIGPIVSAFYRTEQGAVQPNVRTAKTFEQLRGSDDDDVLWTSDLLVLEQLSQQGQLLPIRWVPDRLLSAQFASPNQTWQAFAAAAMVIVVHRELAAESKLTIDSLNDLTDPKWQYRCGVADPTYSHATQLALAAFVQSKSSEQTNAWLDQVTAGAVVLPGELAVIAQVDRGELDWGIVPSDVAAEQLNARSRFEIVFPDQQASQMGTVLIPHAVAVRASAPHPIAAARMANYLVSPQTAERLAMGEPALIPLSTLAKTQPRILDGHSVRWAEVDYKSLRDSCDRVQKAFAKLSSAQEPDLP